MPLSSSRLTSLTAPKTPRRTDLAPIVQGPSSTYQQLFGRPAPSTALNPYLSTPMTLTRTSTSRGRGDRAGGTSALSPALRRLEDANLMAAELGNTRTQFDMDLDRDRFAAERGDTAQAQSRQAAQDHLDRLERDRLAREGETRLSREGEVHNLDVEMRRRQAALNDELAALARGDASPLAPVSAATSTPQQLGILTTPTAGAGTAPMPVSDGMALGRTQVQDRAAHRTSGALRNLEGQMIDRGILGSNLHGNRIGEVVAGQAGDLLDADVEMMLAEQDRLAEVEDRDTALNFQRQESALDRGERRKLSLLDLLQGVRY